MANSLKFFHGTSTASEVTTGNRAVFDQDTANSLLPAQKPFLLGSVAVSTKFQAASDPGVDPIVVSVIDDGTPGGEPATGVKLALSQAGLATAVAGAALGVGPEILSGAVNAITIWVEVDDQTATVGNYLNLRLQTNETYEVPV